jgi:hypothetical protein
VENTEKTIYHYIYENDPKAEELKRKIAEIKSYRKPPFIEADAYYSREPWRKFGGISSGIYMGWCWFRDEYIYSQATEKDIEKAYNEIKGGANG